MILRKCKKLFRLINVYGALGALRQIVNALVYRSPLWPKLLVRSYHDRAAVKLMAGLSEFHSKAVVSVVLPVNNGRTKGVERLVRSLKTQTHKAIELIAVDSGSTDDTVAYLINEGFIVEHIASDAFTHAASRNQGAARATGEYILFVVDDVVFTDSDWLRTAIYLLEALRGDSLSSAQRADGNADPYARCLHGFLATSQSKLLAVNVSRTGLCQSMLHKVLPASSRFRAIAIDDTNHLVRASVFRRLLFKAPTVEDIDFAMRLTASGGRTVYTNLISVLHYHRHTRETVGKYAKRVCIDQRIISDWEPPSGKMYSREQYLVSSYAALYLFCHAMSIVNIHRRQKSQCSREFSDADVVDRRFLDEVCFVVRELYNSFFSGRLVTDTESESEAVSVYRDVVGAMPSSATMASQACTSFCVDHIEGSMRAGQSMMLMTLKATAISAAYATLLYFTWTNMVMSYAGNSRRFKHVERQYPFDSWNMSAWQ